MTSLASAQTARLAKRKAPASSSSTSDAWRPSSDLQKAARQPQKKQKVETAPTSSLDGWLGVHAATVPDLIVPSREIVSGDSTFLAHAAQCKSKAEALAFRIHIRAAHLQDPASHEMLAWRCFELKEGRTGNSTADFAMASGSDEDGEKWSGTHMLKVLEDTKSLDVAVVVSRWFGGELLGPKRFEHIRDVTRDAIEKLSIAAELDSLKEQLLTKDALIAELTELSSPGKVPSYDDLDVVKANRLLLARDKRIALLKTLQAKKAEESSEGGGGFVPDPGEEDAGAGGGFLPEADDETLP